MAKQKWALFVLVILALVLSACTGGAATSQPTSAPVSATQATEPTQPPVSSPTPEALGPAETTQPAQPQGSEPVTLRVGWLGKPDTLNPAYAFLTEAYDIFDLVYGTLTTESPAGGYVGILASDWSNSDDGLTWTFKLRDGIKWHDGIPFTAEDMAWAINAVMQNPDGWAASSNYVSGFKEVKATDPQTLQIVVESPIANMEYRVSFLYAVYPKDFQQFSTAEDLQNFANDKIIGTGPFKMNVFDKDKGILILDANPDYVGGKPAIDQIIFQTFDNADAMIQALKVGDADMLLEVPSSAFETIKTFDGVTAAQEPGRYFVELIVNSVPADHDPAPTRNPSLEDPQVRLALATAINKADLVDIVLQGLGKPGSTIVPPALGSGYWQNPLKDVSFDLAKANQILDEAGYLKGTDGVRTKGNARLEYRLQFPSDNPYYPRAADLLTDWFRQIGVKTNPESVDPDALTAAMTPTGDYDLVIWGWGPDPDPDFILSVLTSDQFVEGGWSDSGYTNPEYDKLYRDQQVTVDQNERQKIVWKMQEIAFNDRPYIVLWYEDLLQAYRSDRFKGFVESALGIHVAQSLLHVEPIR